MGSINCIQRSMPRFKTPEKKPDLQSRPRAKLGIRNINKPRSVGKKKKATRLKSKNKDRERGEFKTFYVTTARTAKMCFHSILSLGCEESGQIKMLLKQDWEKCTLHKKLLHVAMGMFITVHFCNIKLENIYVCKMIKRNILIA